MYCILTLDNENGMMFNHRRQSRDRKHGQQHQQREAETEQFLLHMFSVLSL